MNDRRVILAQELHDGIAQDLVGLGVPLAPAEHITDFLEKSGSAFEQWGADDLVTALLRDLHHGAWFQYGEIDSVVRTSKGERQGCKAGATIFNSAYTFALNDIRSSLASNGIFLRVRYPSGAFWGPVHEADECSHFIADATFVDDE